jgi:Na+-driven multidrug efflux pump
MQVLKILGLGTLLLLLIGFVNSLFVGRSSGTASLSALKAGSIHNPYFWLALALAYGVAVWVVKYRS